MYVLIFGNSITQGCFDTRGGWVVRLQNGERDPLFFNLGVSGDASAKILKRFQPETLARVWPREDLVFVFSMGVNDACIDHGKPLSSPQEFEQNTNHLITQARGFSSKILFIGLTPCVEAKTTPVAWGDYVYKNADLEHLDNLLRNICKKEQLPFVPMLEAFAGREEELLPDGLHPNDEGHELMAKHIKPVLEKLLV